MHGKIVSDRTYNQSQSWWREVVVQEAGKRLRYEIRYNAYRDQSYGRVEVWDGLAWSKVHTLAGASLVGWDQGMYVRQVSPGAFNTDLEELERVAREILW